MRIQRETVWRTAFLLALVLAVEALCRSGVVAASVMPPPSVMVVHSLEVLRSGKFDHDLTVSGLEIVASSVASIVLGFLFGLLLHGLPRVRRSVEPLLASYYAVPTFIFYPIFIVLFGIGPVPIIAIAVLLALVTMVTATLNGLDRIPAVHRKTAQVMQLSTWRRAVHLYLPACAPYLFTGVKLSIAYSFIGVIASEFILSGSGVGYAIGYAYNNFQNSDMYALMLVVLVSITVVNAMLNHVDRRMQSRRRR